MDKTMAAVGAVDPRERLLTARIDTLDEVVTALASERMQPMEAAGRLRVLVGELRKAVAT